MLKSYPGGMGSPPTNTDQAALAGIVRILSGPNGGDPVCLAWAAGIFNRLCLGENHLSKRDEQVLLTAGHGVVGAQKPSGAGLG